MRFLVLLFLISCGSFGEKKKTDTMTVDISENFDQSIQIEKNVETLKTVQNKEEQGVVIFLTPVAYHSINYLKVFEELKNESIKVDKITTAGFTSVVAATYLKYRNTKEAYWKLYKLIKKLEEYPLYSESWFEIVEDYIGAHFSGLKSSIGKMSLDIPILKQNLIVLNNEESLQKSLLRAVKLNKNNWLSTPKDYSYYYAEYEQSNKVLYISAFPETLAFLKSDGFIWGVYSQVGSMDLQRQDRTVVVIENDAELDNGSLVIRGYLNTIIKKSDLLLDIESKSKNSRN